MNFENVYPYVKATHIIFVISWFSGLFYNIRLFVYWQEAREKPEPEKGILSKQFQIMSGRLWHIITWPSSIITLITGTYFIYFYGVDMPDWLVKKLVLVALLYIYHVYSYHIHKKLSRNAISWSSTKYRLWNEIATLLLFAIVFLVVLKNFINMTYGVIGLFSLAILIMIGVKCYKKLRTKR